MKKGQVTQRLTKAQKLAMAKQISDKMVAEMCGVYVAAQSFGHTAAQFYHWRDQYPEEFKDFYDAAQVIITERLKDEAIRRGHDGVDKPVFYKGHVSGYERVYDSTLLIRSIEARDRRFAARNTTEHTGLDGGPIQIKGITIEFTDDPEKFIDPADRTPPLAK